MTKHIYLFLFSFLLVSCGSDEPTTNSQDPANLQLDVLTYDNDSGVVVVSANADNATSYHFFMDDGNDDPFISDSGTYEYTYTTSGAYTIEVRAYGPSGRYMSEDKRVLVSADSPVDIGAGYSTPIEYEGMELVWNDEFNGSALNTDIWGYDIGDGCPNLCGWGNNELEYYRTENVIVQDGLLTIEAKEEQFGGKNYTSGKIVTRGKQATHFGRVDIRAIMPEGQGLWPALWMLGTNQPTVGWPKCGEIDIMEMIGGLGREKVVSANAFWDENGVRDNPRTYSLSTGTLADEFHVFSIIWDEQEICWYINDIMYHTLEISSAAKSEFQNPFYHIMNVAVGGNFPGSPDDTTVFPQRMRVDYIRVFSKN
jgi:beta-glucanase (GH16 family)